MAFEKGQSGNPAGRPKGSENKIKKELRELICNFLIENFEKVQEEFDKMEGKEKVKFYCALLPYGLARKQAEPDILFERLTDEEIDDLLNKLKDAAEKSLEVP